MKNPARPKRDDHGAIVAWGHSTWNPKTRRDLPEYADELVNGRRVTKVALQLIKEKEAKKAEHAAKRPLILDALKAEKTEPNISKILDEDKKTRELQKWKNLNMKHAAVPLRDRSKSRNRGRSRSRPPVKNSSEKDKVPEGNKPPLLNYPDPQIHKYQQSYVDGDAGKEKVEEPKDTEMTNENEEPAQHDV